VPRAQQKFEWTYCGLWSDWVFPFTEELLQSSQRLSASEIVIAGQFISVGEYCLSYVNAAINCSSPEVELDELTRQREDITQQVLRHKNTIWCIRRLPPEIISKFLAFALLMITLHGIDRAPGMLPADARAARAPQAGGNGRYWEARGYWTGRV
jgi:hypothetical protein